MGGLKGDLKKKGKAEDNGYKAATL